MTETPIYINGLGNVSPQKTTDSTHFLEEPVLLETNRLKCIDPGFKEYIPADMIRRMSRIIKMGVAASKICLKDAGIGQNDILLRDITPDAIITGTGLGCVEDTEKFLTSMISNREEFLTPTSFIQSTHNTVAGQIALLLKCHGYNFTYVHRGVSFESALIDAMTQIKMGEFSNVLVGGSDEITDPSFAITSRLGYWKRKPVHPLNLLNDPQRGSIAGEGASFLFLENQKTDKSYARLTKLTTFLKPGSIEEIHSRLHDFLSGCGMTVKDISLVILGLNGDPRTDQVYRQLAGSDFRGATLACFKHLCGEYHTSSAFATWLAAMMLRNQFVPEVVTLNEKGNDPLHISHAAEISHKLKPHPHPLEHVLIYNHFQGNNHAFILLSRP